MRLRLVFALVCTVGMPAPVHAAGPVRVYPIGDSITYGATFGVSVPAVGVGTLVNTPGGYRGDLDALLTAGSVAHQFVGTRTDNSNPVLDATGQNHHDGWPGWRVDQIDTAITGWLNGGVQPDVVVIHLGTNDIGQRYDPATTYPTGDGRVNYADATQRATFVADLAARLDALVDKIQTLRPNVRIVVSDVVPIAATGGTGAPHLATRDFAAAAANVVAAEQAGGDKVVFADVYTRFVTTTDQAGTVVVPGLLSHDNVHPTPAGYAVMADVYDDAVVAVLTR